MLKLRLAPPKFQLAIEGRPGEVIAAAIDFAHDLTLYPSLDGLFALTGGLVPLGIRMLDARGIGAVDALLASDLWPSRADVFAQGPAIVAQAPVLTAAAYARID